MNWRERIVMDRRVLDGKPIVRNTRLSVEHVVAQLANGWTVEDLTSNYPGLQAEDVRACLAYAAEALAQERVYPLSA